MKNKIIRLVFLVVLVLGINGPVRAETFMWTDTNGTVHFTDDQNALPPDHGTVKKVKEEPVQTYTAPKETKSEVNRTLANDPKTRLNPNYYCNEATRLQRNIEYAKAEYQAYLLKDLQYRSRHSEQSYYNNISRGEKQLADFEERARKNGVPPGWLDCRFD